MKIAADLANILVEPPESKPRQSKLKTLDTARVCTSIPGSSAIDTLTAAHKSTENAQPSINSENNTALKCRKPQASKPKSDGNAKVVAKRTVKQSNGPVVDNENIVCIVCTTSSQQYFWFGCDNCNNWVHYE